jgi:hypothetical protein
MAYAIRHALYMTPMQIPTSTTYPSTEAEALKKKKNVSGCVWQKAALYAPPFFSFFLPRFFVAVLGVSKS